MVYVENSNYSIREPLKLVSKFSEGTEYKLICKQLCLIYSSQTIQKGNFINILFTKVRKILFTKKLVKDVLCMYCILKAIKHC